MTGLTANELVASSEVAETIAVEVAEDELFVVRKIIDGYEVSNWFDPSGEDRWTKVKSVSWEAEQVSEEEVRQYAKFKLDRAENPFAPEENKTMIRSILRQRQRDGTETIIMDFESGHEVELREMGFGMVTITTRHPHAWFDSTQRVHNETARDLMQMGCGLDYEGFDALDWFEDDIYAERCY